MKTLSWEWQDKSTWGPGPWQGEPDRRQWPDRTTGMPCLMLRKEGLGHWCGYVGVAPGHPLYGIPYNRCALRPTPCADDDCAHSPEALLDVHGGLTFAGACQEHPQGICHVADPGEEATIWWLGFDAVHAGDLAPGMEATLRLLGMDRTPRAATRWLPVDVYRTVDYMTAECARLAVQLDDRDFAERLR